MKKDKQKFWEWLSHFTSSKVVIRVVLSYHGSGQRDFSHFYGSHFELFCSDTSGRTKLVSASLFLSQNKNWKTEPLTERGFQDVWDRWHRERLDEFTEQQQLVAQSHCAMAVSPLSPDFWLVREELAKLEGFLLGTQQHALGTELMPRLNAFRCESSQKFEKQFQGVQNWLNHQI